MTQYAIIFQQKNLLIEQIHFLKLQNRTVEIAISKEQQRHKISSGSLSVGLLERYQGGLFSMHGVPYCNTNKMSAAGPSCFRT